MPISRKRACAQCRRAKARCSLTAPRCFRCRERALTCDYAGHAPRPNSYFSVSPPASLDNPVESQPGASPAGKDGISGTLNLFSQQPPAIIASSPEEELAHPSGNVDWASVNLGDMGAASLLDSGGTVELLSPSRGPLSWPEPASSNQSIPVSGGEIDDEDTRRRRAAAGSGTQSDLLLHDENFLILSRRRPITTCALTSTRIMLGQVESYPMMMVDGGLLPPFIHSRCALDDGQSHECSSRGPHQCLPPKLSICASLVHMFKTKTAGSSRFVWETIYTEVNRLHREYHGYGIEDLLQAVQATSIYVILQAHDQESRRMNDVQGMIKVLASLSYKLSGISDFCTHVEIAGQPLNRGEWVLRESTRRTMCLLYVVEMLLEFTIGTGDITCCQNFENTPLPCTRALWEAPSTHEWSQRYKTYLRCQGTERLLTVHDFKASQGLPPEHLVNRGSSVGVLGDVMRWCEGMDQFCTMVWLAASLVRKDTGSSIYTRYYASVI